MFGRKTRPMVQQRDPLGIGALVRVVPDGRGDQWDGEPIGVIVAPGGNQIVGYPGVGQAVSWTVAFDGHAYTVDGRGPFERASISSAQLVPLEGDPVVDEFHEFDEV